jgi:DNA repair protein RecN (Recombination protein N)
VLFKESLLFHDYQTLLDRIVSLSIELDDIGEELSKSSEKLINDPEN